MSLLFPEVRDIGSLGAKFSIPYYLPIAVEGQGGTTGTAVVGTVYQINTPSDADTYFGAGSPLNLLLKHLLGRGITPIWAAASVLSATPPTLVQRQAVWATLETMPNIRIRMTDDVAQATLVAHAASCDNAALVFNKQIAFGGMAAGTTKAALIAAAEAINSRRSVFVGPGVYDSNGTLLSGVYAAAAVAAAVATNSDISDSLNLFNLPNLNGIEMGANGQPIFTERVVSGVAVNDFEDLLQKGVSPLMTDRDGLGVRITHLRMTYTGTTPGSAPIDTTYDSLMTRLIVDQIFLDVRQYAYDNKFLRKGNTPKTRDALAAGIDALLNSRSAWIAPVTQADGTPGYAVSIIPSTDLRSVTIQYQGVVIRGLETINVDAELTIPV